LNTRYKIFYIFAAAILTITVLRMFFLASYGGKSYRQEADNTSAHHGELSAIRGRIYDENDQLLAWSERSCDLLFRAEYSNDNDFENMCRDLKKHFPHQLLQNLSRRYSSVVKYDLTAAELTAADRLCSIYPALEIELRWERRIKHHRPELGEVRQENGTEYGISGWEKEFDDILRGQPGKFKVMLDRRGRWIDSTFRIVQASRNGQDIYLSDEKAHDDQPQ